MVEYFQSFLRVDEEQVAPSTQHNREFLNIARFLQFLIRRDYKPSELYAAYTDFVRLGTYLQPLEVRETLDDRLFPSLTQERREKRVYGETEPNGLNEMEKRSEVGNQQVEVESGQVDKSVESEMVGERRILESENNNNNSEIESEIETKKENQSVIHEIEIPSTLHSKPNQLLSHSSIPTKRVPVSRHSVLESLLYQPIETVSPTLADSNRIRSLLSFVCRERDFLSISPFILNRFLFSS